MRGRSHNRETYVAHVQRRLHFKLADTRPESVTPWKNKVPRSREGTLPVCLRAAETRVPPEKNANSPTRWRGQATVFLRFRGARNGLATAPPVPPFAGLISIFQRHRCVLLETVNYGPSRVERVNERARGETGVYTRRRT